MKGVWTRTYIHLGTNSQKVDRHQSRSVCEFPIDGSFAYIQHNIFTHSDDRIDRAFRMDGSGGIGRYRSNLSEKINDINHHKQSMDHNCIRWLKHLQP